MRPANKKPRYTHQQSARPLLVDYSRNRASTSSSSRHLFGNNDAQPWSTQNEELPMGAVESFKPLRYLGVSCKERESSSLLAMNPENIDELLELGKIELVVTRQQSFKRSGPIQFRVKWKAIGAKDMGDISSNGQASSVRRSAGWTPKERLRQLRNSTMSHYTTAPPMKDARRKPRQHSAPLPCIFTEESRSQENKEDLGKALDDLRSDQNPLPDSSSHSIQSDSSESSISIRTSISSTHSIKNRVRRGRVPNRSKSSIDSSPHSSWTFLRDHSSSLDGSSNFIAGSRIRRRDNRSPVRDRRSAAAKSA